MGLLNRITKDEWNVAFRTKSGAALYEDGGLEKSFIVIGNTWRYWCADPFVVKEGDCNYIFMEVFDRLKNKGLLGYVTIKNGKAGKIKIIYEHAKHLSYPFITKVGNEYFIMPECNQSGKIFTVKAIHFPDKWQYDKIIMDNVKVCDATTVTINDTAFMFLTPIVADNTSLLDVYVKDDDKWRAIETNHVINDKKIARPGGAFICAADKVIRVSQDCTDGYGAGLNFSEIVELNEKNYKERLIIKIKPTTIKTNCNKKFCGIHTYNSNDEYEVIDLKSRRKRFANVLGFGLRKLKIIR